MNELFRVLISYRSTIDNPCLLSNLISWICNNPLSDEIMSILSDLSWSSFTCANGPYRLISKDNLRPIFDTPFNCIELLSQHFISQTSFPLFKRLPNANDRVHTLILSAFNLFSNNLIGFSKELPSFRVTNDHPLDTEVLHLLSTNFTSVSPASILTYVLSAYLNVSV